MRLLILFSLIFINFINLIYANFFKTTLEEKNIFNAYYFTPSDSNGTIAAFGYISKLRATEKQKIIEKQIIKNIILNNKIIKNLPQNLKINKLSNKDIKTILNTIPLYIKQNPQYNKLKKNNLGKCGVILIKNNQKIKKIKLGINTPIKSLSISSDSKYLAVLSDFSFYDSNGTYHYSGKISFIKIKNNKITKEFIFRNLANKIKFIPNTHILAISTYCNFKDISKRKLYFFNFDANKFLNKTFNYTDNIKGKILNKYIDYPAFKFNNNFIALQNKNFLYIYSIKDYQLIFKLINSGRGWDIANKNPIIVSDHGIIYNFVKELNLANIEKNLYSPLLPFLLSKFCSDDKYIYFLKANNLYKYDIKNQKIIQSTKKYKFISGLFYIKDKFIFLIAKKINKKFIQFIILDKDNFKIKEKIELPAYDILNLTSLQSKLIISSCNTIYIYKYK